MYRKFQKLDRWSRIGIVVIVIWILGWSLFIGFQLQSNHSNAVGGGVFVGGRNNVVVNATTNVDPVAGNALAAEIKGNYLVIGVTSLSPHTVANTVTDTAGDTYVLAIRSTKYENAAIWYANYTGTNFAANSITVTFNASTSSQVQLMVVTGIVTGTIQTSSGNGTASSTSVTSFTPNPNFACINYASVNSGSATATTFTAPSFWYNTVANKIVTTFDTNTQSDNNWAGFGATTVSTAFTPTVGTPQWDSVVVCFPQGPATSTTTSTTTTSTTTSTTSTSTAYNYIERQNQTNAVNNPTLTFLITSKVATIKNNLLIVTVRNIKATTNDTFSISDNQSNTWIKKNAAWRSGFSDIVTFLTNASASTVIKINITATQNPVRISGFFHEFNLQEPFLSKAINATATTSTIQVPSFTTNYSNFVYSFAFGRNTSNGNRAVTALPASTIKSYNVSNSITTNTWAEADGYFYGARAASNEKYTFNSAVNASEIVLIFRIQATVTSTSSTTTSTTSTTTTTTISTTPTTTTTTSTTTSTSLTSSTATTTSTLTSTNVTTITGTVIPEPAGSTDLLLIVLAIMIFLIMMVIGVIKRNPFPTFLGAMVLLIMNVGLYTNNKIVYSQNIITTPLWVNEMITLLVVFAFVLCIYQMAKRR